MGKIGMVERKREMFWKKEKRVDDRKGIFLGSGGRRRREKNEEF